MNCRLVWMDLTTKLLLSDRQPQSGCFVCRILSTLCQQRFRVVPSTFFSYPLLFTRFHDFCLTKDKSSFSWQLLHSSIFFLAVNFSFLFIFIIHIFIPLCCWTPVSVRFVSSSVDTALWVYQHYSWSYSTKKDMKVALTFWEKIIIIKLRLLSVANTDFREGFFCLNNKICFPNCTWLNDGFRPSLNTLDFWSWPYHLNEWQ